MAVLGQLNSSVDPKLASGDGRHKVLVSVEFWRRTRLILLYMAFVMLVGEGITVVKGHVFSPSYVVLAAFLVLLAAAIYWRQRTHYVEVGPEGLVIRSGFKSETISYQNLRQSRCQPLRQFFDAPSRRDLFTGGLRRFSSSPICVVRVELDQAELLRLGKLLGRRTVLDQDLLLLVQGAASLDLALQARIRKRPPTASSRPSRRR